MEKKEYFGCDAKHTLITLYRTAHSFAWFFCVCVYKNESDNSVIMSDLWSQRAPTKWKLFHPARINREGQRIEWIKEIKIVTKLIPNGKMWMLCIYKANQSANKSEKASGWKEREREKKKTAQKRQLFVWMCALLHVYLFTFDGLFVRRSVLHPKLLPFFM